MIESQILPGFRFRRRDLLELPDLADLALDETYAAYVIPGYYDAVTRLEQAEEQGRALQAGLVRLRKRSSWTRSEERRGVRSE